jgi:hypothetical protein
MDYSSTRIAMFNRKSPEQILEGETKKTAETLEKYGLNLDAYSTEDIKKKNVLNLQKIARDLLGNNFFKAGLALSFAKASEQATVTYLSALVEQNWILVRQNEIVIKELQRIGRV